MSKEKILISDDTFSNFDVYQPTLSGISLIQMFPKEDKIGIYFSTFCENKMPPKLTSTASVTMTASEHNENGAIIRNITDALTHPHYKERLELNRNSTAPVTRHEYSNLLHTPLAEAITSRDNATFQRLVSSDFNLVDKHQRAPLMAACARGSLEEVRSLLNAGADISLKDDLGNHCLHYCARYNRHDIAQILKNSQYDKYKSLLVTPNLKDETPFMIALVAGGDEMTKWLSDADGLPWENLLRRSSNPLIISAMLTQPQFSKLFSENTLVAYINHKDATGKTALHHACDNGDLRSCKILIEAGAEIGIKDEEGVIPFMLAAKNGKLELLKYFIEERKINAEVYDNKGKNAVQYAIESHNVEGSQYLIQSKVNVALEKNKNTALLHSAFIEPNLEIINILLQSPVIDVDGQDENKHTALHHMCRRKNIKIDMRTKIIEILIKRGADISCGDNEGNTPLILATKSKEIQIIETLLRLENQAKNSKRTPQIAMVDNKGRSSYSWAIGWSVSPEEEIGYSLELINILKKNEEEKKAEKLNQPSVSASSSATSLEKEAKPFHKYNPSTCSLILEGQELSSPKTPPYESRPITPDPIPLMLFKASFLMSNEEEAKSSEMVTSLSRPS